MDPSDEGQDRERADMALFATRNPAGILRVYDGLAAGGGQWPICWPGVLAPQAWFLYRRMYLWAALVSAGPLLLAYVPQLSWLNWSTSLVGAAGLRLYVGGARRTIAGIRAGADDVIARALIARAGGVSRIGAAIGLLFAFSQFVLSLKAGAPAIFAPR